MSDSRKYKDLVSQEIDAAKWSKLDMNKNLLSVIDEFTKPVCAQYVKHFFTSYTSIEEKTINKTDSNTQVLALKAPYVCKATGSEEQLNKVKNALPGVVTFEILSESKESNQYKIYFDVISFHKLMQLKLESICLAVEEKVGSKLNKDDDHLSLQLHSGLPDSQAALRGYVIVFKKDKEAVFQSAFKECGVEFYRYKKDVNHAYAKRDITEGRLAVFDPQKFLQVILSEQFTPKVESVESKGNAKSVGLESKSTLFVSQTMKTSSKDNILSLMTEADRSCVVDVTEEAKLAEVVSKGEAKESYYVRFPISEKDPRVLVCLVSSDHNAQFTLEVVNTAEGLQFKRSNRAETYKSISDFVSKYNAKNDSNFQPVKKEPGQASRP